MKKNFLDNKTILITGGTGTLGRELTRTLFKNYHPKKVIIFSRDEYKQFVMKEELLKENINGKLRFFIGDVRDKDRLYRAFEGVDYVVHAAALKQVPSCEYNPFEAVKTNIYGAQNVIEAAIDRRIKKVIALSTDKAANPINLYGATKLCSDKIFISGNAYSGASNAIFSVVRYGNVAGSRGSVIALFSKLIEEKKELPITDKTMTRFWITISEAVDLVITALKKAKGGEIFVPKIPSFNILDLVKAMSPHAKVKEIGIRPGEKIYETMITRDDSRLTYDYGNYYLIYPNHDFWIPKIHFHNHGKKVPEGFKYSSDMNPDFLDVVAIQKRLATLKLEQ